MAMDAHNTQKDDNMSTTLNVFVFLLFISKALGGLLGGNVLNAVSKLTTRPLNNAATNRKDFIKLASERGYDVETHEVTTDDGYILTLYRIPPGDKCPKKAPMLMVHGLFQSAECFVSSGEDAPGFTLAQDCYDVWFANVRGTYHSRKHKTLDADKDAEFWNFSRDEIGYYDLPAIIDYILDSTSSKKLMYLGFSQGGGTFIIMNSERPEYADKVSLFIGLAPSTRHFYTRSALFRGITVAMQASQVLLEAAGVTEVVTTGFPLQASLGTLCHIELLAAPVCGTTLALLDSPHPGSVTSETYTNIFDNFPAGTSVKNLAKYGQAMQELQYVKFDYGSKQNLKKYGSPEPPQYNMTAVTTPAVVFHGKADHFVDTRDAQWVTAQLPNLVEDVEVEDPLWDHVDMVYSSYWKDTLYNTKIKEYLNKYDCIDDIAE